MIFTQYYLACLSHASYLIGDETTGRAVVVDPRRDVNIYLDEAAEHGLHIERVIETHIHADFLSGHPVRPASDRRGGRRVGRDRCGWLLIGERSEPALGRSRRRREAGRWSGPA